MYHKCPKCGFLNDALTKDKVCPECGLVFDKWLKNRFKGQLSNNINTSSSVLSSTLQKVKKQIFCIPENFSKPRLYLNVVIYIVFFIWGWSFIFADHYSAELNNSFMHLINLVFHEAGHVIFMLLGHFMTILGGSLMQLLVPLIILLSLLVKNKDAFGASIGLWWLAQSMMDLVAYIDDAQRQEMWLLGGVQGKDMPGIHDWNNILSQLSLLKYDHVIAVLVSWIAIFLMILSFLWGAVLLRKMREQK